ncbi:MAG: MaoC family dehydratase [Chloroflexi bacterium]|nr:MaoC family dehydratase [Chloroflexota bacterium]MCI0786232.1 MaoC family dehydratase [Chloroflexota bacterium]MCI0792625.1 MaoC family dehydratase [Chloroflexota bacterium]MCI0798536.1 MaoC family dehydratase [Chloroflexota bacterium]MCI0859070.1 MaoC family dehydratase [Chloroflexota bacterium]
MVEQAEKLWDYDVVEPGQEGTRTVVEVTAEHIARYALLAQYPAPRYQKAGVNPEYGGALVAMPTMVLSYAPLLREEIAEANGFVAVEQSLTARRQTPFAKCEIRWSGPVMAGDTITATRRVLEKYERRGNKFVTFRVQAVNQHGQQVAQYDYTCIFEYSQGQKSVPQDRGSAQPPPLDSRPEAAPVATPSLSSYDTISVGDQLATLSIVESQEIINRKSEFRLAGRPNPSNIHTDEEFARQNIFGGTVNSGPATMSYVDQMLEQSFPLRAFYEGGSLLMRGIEPFRAGDTVTFQGEVTTKQGDADDRALECRVKGLNQRGDLVSLSDARLVLLR